MRRHVAAATEDRLRVGDMVGGVGLLLTSLTWSRIARSSRTISETAFVKGLPLAGRPRNRSTTVAWAFVPTATSVRDCKSLFRPAGSLTCRISIGPSRTTFAGTIT